MPPTPTDPLDWAGIAASQGNSVPLWERTLRENPPNPNPSAKELLDAYRALNGGKLPPGMTPQQAALIDMGLMTSLVSADPSLQALLQSLAQQRVQTKADFAAARQQVGENYQNLTGDVEEQGQNFLNEILQQYGIPADQVAYDPNLTGYGETIANMGETADQMQATDQAWFDKMGTVYDQNALNMMQSLATTPLVPPELSGGGGGGGGRGGGYRRRGYGGGGGDGGGSWKDPSTTDSMTEAAQVTAHSNFPGYQDEVLQAVFDASGGDLDAVEYAQQLLDLYGTSPSTMAQQVGKGIVGTELPRVNAALEAQLAQAAQRKLYYEQLPVQAGGALGRVQSTAGDIARAEEKGQPVAPLQGTDKAAFWADLYSGVMNETANRYAARPAWYDRVVNAVPGFSGRRSDSDAAEEAFRQRAMYGQQELDKQRLADAQSAATTQNPFTYKNWKGYVEEVPREDIEENQWIQSILNNVLATTRANNPNYDWRVTNMQQKDSSNTKTTQKSRAPEDQLFDNNLDESGYVTPLEFEEEMNQAPAPGNLGTSWGYTRGSNLSEAGQRTMANRMELLKNVALQRSRERSQAGSVGTTGTRNRPDGMASPRRVGPTGRPPAQAYRGNPPTTRENPVRSVINPWDRFAKPFGQSKKKKKKKAFGPSGGSTKNRYQ